MLKKFLVTGGAGFIGSAVVRKLIRDTPHQVLVVDKLTYAGNLDSLAPYRADSPLSLRAGRHLRRRADAGVLSDYQPDVIMHLAAESHVDRSIDGPAQFMQTNVVGTFTLLASGARLLAQLAARARDASASTMSRPTRSSARLGEDGLLPRGLPLSAQLALLGLEGRIRPLRARLASHLWPADADHQLLQQLRAVSFSREAHPADDPQCVGGKPLPVYGKGENVRDWLYVDDHAEALFLVAQKGRSARATTSAAGTSAGTSMSFERSVARG